MKTFILVRKSPKSTSKFQSETNFPKVVICDTRVTVPAVIDGRETRVYKPVSEVMDYLDAYPKMVEMNASV